MASPIPVRYKDPSDVFFVLIDYAEWLAEIGDDTISTSAWTGEDGITVAHVTKTDTTATGRVSGGTLYESYIVTNHIVTAAGQEKDRSIEIQVRHE